MLNKNNHRPWELTPISPYEPTEALAPYFGEKPRAPWDPYPPVGKSWRKIADQKTSIFDDTPLSEMMEKLRQELEDEANSRGLSIYEVLLERATIKKEVSEEEKICKLLVETVLFLLESQEEGLEWAPEGIEERVRALDVTPKDKEDAERIMDELNEIIKEITTYDRPDEN